MRPIKPLIFLCAAIGAAWTVAAPSSAQDAPFAFAPVTLDPSAVVADRSASHGQSTTPPSGATSSPEPANQPAASDDSSDAPLYGCACGCGIFEVGTRSMLPQGTGGMIYLAYDFQDQNIDWQGNSAVSKEDNSDKEIRTSFVTVGIQYMFNRSWGIQAEVPFAHRYFKTTGGASGTDVVPYDWTALGDIRVQGIYSGFFPDQSLGMLFGVKLPTGSFTANDSYGDVDRDSEIGTGSTDLLLGAFYRNNITPDGKLGWFAQLDLDLPILIQDGYRPGAEGDAALGAYLSGIRLGRVGIVPIAQVLGSVRGSDGGNQASANPVQSGYERVLLSPGVEVDVHPFMLYADIEVPVYCRTTGPQLVAPYLIKVILAYHF